MSFPASLGVARSSLRPSRSYTSSTGRHREPLGQNISTCVEIPVVPNATFRADPFTHIQWEVFDHMLAVIARFTRWIPTIDFDEGSSVPLALVFQLADKLTPSDITDSFGQTVVFDHVLDGQTLHADHLVFVDDACREFVLVVSPTVIDTGMNTGDLTTCFLPVLGTFFLFRMPTSGLLPASSHHGHRTWDCQQPHQWRGSPSISSPGPGQLVHSQLAKV